MKRGDFSDDAPGELVTVAGGIAFVPFKLAPLIPASWVLHRAAEEARAALAELSVRIGQLQEPERLLHLLRRREAVLSSRIEGTVTQVRDVLLAEAAPPTAQDETADLREVLNYTAALEHGRRLLADGYPLHQSLIRGLHEQLMHSVRGANRHPGKLRATQVQIGGSALAPSLARFVPPPAEHVPPLLDDLVLFMSRDLEYGPLIECAILHYQFEAIHPFEDGNGRIGRLLIPLYLQSRSAIDRPVLYVSAFLEEHRDEYIDHLYNVSTKGAWLPWILFFLTAVREQALDTDRRAKNILAIHRAFQELSRPLRNKAAYKAVDLIMSKVVVSVSDVASYTNAAYPTARAALDQLTAAGLVVSIGRKRGKELWVAEQLLRELEGPAESPASSAAP